MTRYKATQKPRKKPKRRKPPARRKPKRKPARRCCGRSFKTAFALASHKRGRQHAEATYQAPRRKAKRWFTPRPVKFPPVRKCAICGDHGDHGGDGHPFERWDDEPRKVVVPRRVRPFVLRQVFGVMTPRSEL